MSEVVKKAAKLEQWAEDKACAFLVNAPGGTWQENVSFLAQTFEMIHAGAYRAGQIAQAKADAKILREQLDEATQPDQRMTLAIAIRAIERGRNLTKVEQMKNLMDAIDEFDREESAHLRAEGDLK